MQIKKWMFHFVAFQCFAGALFAGTHSASSGPTVVDTRDKGVPTIRLSGNYFTPGSHAYFLSGVSVSETVMATVDWNGREAGKIQFIKNNYVIASTTPDSVTFDLGAWDAGTKLAAHAVSADGVKSEVVSANFDIIPRPYDLDYTFGALPFRYTADFMRTVFTVSAKIPEDLPVIGGTGADANFVVMEKMTVRRDGTAVAENDDFFKDGTLGFHIGETVISPKYDTQINMYYNGSQWKFLKGEVEIGLEVEHEFFKGQGWGPFYITASLLGSAEGRFFLDDYGTYANSQFDAGLGLALYGAIGVDYLLNAGPYGSAQMISGWQVPKTPTWYKFGVTGELGLKGEVMGLNKSWPFIDGEYWFRHPDKQSSETAMRALFGQLAAESVPSAEDLTTGYTQPARDYLHQPVRMASMALADDAPAAGPEVYLRENVYTYTASGIATLDSERMLVWVRDNPDRSDENRCELVWQRDSGAGWSAPLAVADNGTGDHNPSVKPLGSDRYVAVWQDQNKVHPAGIDLPDLMAAAEISAAVFNSVSGTWTVDVLTDDAVYDATPMLDSAPDGTAMAVWVRNVYTHLTGSAAEPNEFVFSFYDGSGWSAPQSVITGLGMIMGSDFAYNGSEATLVYVLDADDDYATPEDQELYSCVYSNGAWSTPVRLTNNSVEDSNPRVGYTSAGSEIVWLEDGMFRTQADLPFGTNSVVGRGFHLVTGPNDEKALVWSDGDIQTVFYDDSAECWNLPVAQTATKEVLEKRLSACFTPDGNLLISHNRDIMVADSSGYVDVSRVDLAVIEIHPAPDPAVMSISLSGEIPLPGSTVDIQVEVRNKGELACSGLLLSVYDGDPGAEGVLIDTVAVPGWFIGGSQTNLSVQWEISDGTGPRRIHAVVSSDADKDATNNRLSQELSGLNFAVSAVWMEVPLDDDGVAVVRATITNSGSLSYTNGINVSFHLGSPSGTVIGVDSVYPVNPGSDYDASVELDFSEHTFTEGFMAVYAVVDPEQELAELSRSDNVAFTMFMTPLDSDGDGVPDGEELLAGNDPLVPEWRLTVTGGDGTGRYTNQAVVAVIAEAAPAGQVFERWMGDTQYVAQVTSATTTVIMPAEDIALSSVYQKSGLGHLGSFLLEGLNPDEVKSADQWFRTAVNQDPLDYPARVYSAVTLLLNLMNDAELLDLMEQFGFAFEEDLSVGGWMVAGELNFTGAPPSNEAVDTVWTRTQPALDEALALLASIPDTWTGSAEISAEIFPVDETVYVDYADTVAARALLASLRSFLNTARAYDLTVDYQTVEWPVTIPEGEITLDGDPSDWAGIPVQLAGEDESDLRSVKACISGNTVFALIESELLLKDGGGYMGIQLNVRIDGEKRTLDAFCLIDGNTFTSGFWIGMDEYEAQAIHNGRYLELAFPVPSELTLELGGTVVRTEHAAWWNDFWEWAEEELEFPHHHPAQSLLAMAPGLLRSVRNEEALTQARSDLTDGLAFGQDAAERIKSRSGGPLRFFEYDPEDEENYDRLAVGLADASDSLAAPKRIDTFGYNDGLTVHLGALYAAPFVTRDMLPAYAPEALWNRPTEGSFPDPIFGGVFPLMTQDDLSSVVNREVFNEPDLFMLQVVSQYGTSLPASGIHWFFKDSAVTCSVPSSVISDGINMRCIGWTGTGSVPASGSTNTTGGIVLTHLQSAIKWNWETSFAVTNLVAQQRPGTKLVDVTYDVISDVTNSVQISLTVMNGSVSIPSQTVTGDIGVVPPGTGKTAVWDAGADWNGQSGELTLSVLHALQPQFISTGSGTVNTLDYRLAVAAAPESGVQISGTHPGTSAYTNLLAYRTAVELTAPESYDSGTTRLRFVEWSGSVTTSVRTVSFAMNGDKDLMAVYGIERIIQVTAPRNGRIDPAGTVAAAQGYPHTFTATPDQGYRLKHWLVDGSIAGDGQRNLTVDVTGDRTVAAVFEPVWLVFEGRSQRQMLDETGGKRGEPAVLKDTLSTLLVVNRDRPGQTNAVLISWGKRGAPSAIPVAVLLDDSSRVSAKNDKAGQPAAERNLWSLSIRDNDGKSLLIGTFDGAYRYDKSGVLSRVQQRASLNGTGLVPDDPSVSTGLLRLNQTAGDALNKQDGDFDAMAAALRAQIKKLPAGISVGTLGGLLQDAAGE